MNEPSKAVFLSYASEDSDAARRICEALRAGGIEVWFDQSELRGGDAWDQKIRREIRECALFVAVISANSQSRLEGYFRREWKLAVDRTHDMAAEKPFLIPVVIDDTKDRLASVPEEFHAVQWTRLHGGETPAAFAEQVTRLLSADHSLPFKLLPEPSGQPGASVRQANKSRAMFLWLLIPLGALALGYVMLTRFTKSPSSASPSATPAAVAVPSQGSDSAAIPEKSIAVLPFLNMSSDKEQEYFSDGLSEELIDLLTHVPDLRVPARTSSFYFKGRTDDIATIAKKLRVSHLLEGSVRRAGSRLRITAQLIKADSGYHVWSESYDRDAKDIFKVQDEIAAAVVGVLKVKLMSAPDSSARQTRNPEAYSQYLLGRQITQQDNWKTAQRAVDAFHNALQLDSAYAPAWAGLALALDLASEEESVSTTDWQRGKQAALRAAEKAIFLAPNLADGYVSRGSLRAWRNRDFAGSAADYQRALALDPDSPSVWEGYASSVLLPTGRLDEALSAMQKALQFDPLSATNWRRFGKLQSARHEYPAAIKAFNRSLDLTPEQSNTAAYLGYCLLLEGKPAEALTTSQRSTEEVFRLNAAAMAQHDLQDTAEAQKQLNDLIEQYRSQAAYQVAEVYAWWGDADHAFEWLETAYVQRDGGLTLIKADPLLDKLHGDPRFATLLRRMNLPE